MNRKNFIKACGAGCLGMALVPVVLPGCAGTKYLDAPIDGSNMVVPLSAFELVKDNAVSYRRYIVAENEKLQFPICIYRVAADQYHALWMKCTHQGTELHAFGDRLQCPAHGSEFTNTGAVQNGPASDPLRAFPVTVDGSNIKINLS